MVVSYKKRDIYAVKSFLLSRNKSISLPKWFYKWIFKETVCCISHNCFEPTSSRVELLFILYWVKISNCVMLVLQIQGTVHYTIYILCILYLYNICNTVVCRSA